MNALLGTKAVWYLMRGSGFVAFGLLTITVAMGIANLARWQRSTGARAVTALIHRNASLLSVVFLAIHVVTAVADKYVTIPIAAVMVPGLSGYDPVWVGLGALSLDVMVALIVTSLARARIGRRTWRAVHWVAYLSWPTALVHAIGSGSGSGVDTGSAWSTAIYVGCGLLFAVAVVGRLATGGRLGTRGSTLSLAPAVTDRDPVAASIDLRTPQPTGSPL